MKRTFPFAILILIITFISCEDDPISEVENGDPPEIPSLEFMKPDLSYFEGETLNHKNSSDSSFSEARISIFLLEMITTMSDLYIDLLASADKEDAVFVDGKWVWEYSYTTEWGKTSVKLTAEEKADSYNWSLSISEDTAAYYTILSGNTLKDGSGGSWEMKSLLSPQSTPMLKSDWTKYSDTHWESSTEYLRNGEVLLSYRYLREENENSLVVMDYSSDNMVFIFWDSDTGTGFIQKVGDETSRRCWDSNFQDVECL